MNTIHRLMKRLRPVAVAIAITGCGEAIPTPPRAIAPAAANAASATSSIGASTANAVGYVHALSRSRFDLGDFVATRYEAGLEKHVGSAGVFATRMANGAIMAVPNSEAPSRRRGSFGGSAAAHNEYVKGYFVSSGIPADQIHSVHANAHGVGHLAAADQGKLPQPELVGYSTVLFRAIDGIRVPDSVAWARADATGAIVAEEVYWPTIAASEVQAAKAMRARLADPAEGPHMLAALGAIADDVEVVIRHGGSTVDAAAEPHAAYDVRVKAGATSYRRHFDAKLNEFRLAHELVQAQLSPTPDKR
jgi:hypothetical protein